MNVFALAGWITILAAPFAAALGDDASAPSAQPGLRSRLSGDVIRNAVKETLAEAPASRRESAPALRAERYEAFGRQVEEARVPSCWRPDAMKHQPPMIGPVMLTGTYALPFLAAAIARGKCNL